MKGQIDISGEDFDIDDVRVEFYPTIKCWSAYYRDAEEGEEGTLYVGNGDSLEESLTQLEKSVTRGRKGST